MDRDKINLQKSAFYLSPNIVSDIMEFLDDFPSVPIVRFNQPRPSRGIIELFSFVSKPV